MKSLFLLLVFGLVALGAFAEDTSKRCTGCKKVAGLLANVTSNEENKKGLVKLCDDYSFLPGQQTVAWCKKAVDRFFELVKNNVDVDRVCYDIRACTGTEDILRLPLPPLDNGIGDDADCNLCVDVLKRMKDMLTGSLTELDLKMHIKAACHAFPSIEKDCEQILDEYIDSLFTYINQTFQPRELCQSMKLCPSSLQFLFDQVNVVRTRYGDDKFVTPVQTDPVMPLPVSENERQNPINCAICKKLVRIIQRQLKDNATDTQIINVLTEVCEVFPRSDRDSCRTVVKDYAKNLIDALTKDVDPDMACAMAGLCVPKRFANYVNGYYLQTTEPSTVKKNVACEECELIAHFIQNEMYNYKNEEQVETFIKNVMCKQLSYFIKEKDCETFVTSYTPIIMQMIAQEVFDPNTLCFKEIKVCIATTIMPRQETNCQMCKRLVKNMAALPNNEIVSIENITKSVCKYMPQAAKVECALMLKAFGPYFAESVDRLETAQEICRSIDLCMTPGRVHLLGGHKCTYGPSYWCHSEQHASACGSLDYCREKVWSSGSSN